MRRSGPPGEAAKPTRRDSPMLRSTSRGGLRAVVLLSAVFAICAAIAPVAAQAGGDVKVMTRNLYLGTGLTNLPGTSGVPFIQNVTTDFGNVVANNWPARAQALAAEIQAKQPDLV